jgi:hypothetical protein
MKNLQISYFNTVYGRLGEQHLDQSLTVTSKPAPGHPQTGGGISSELAIAHP